MEAVPADRLMAAGDAFRVDLGGGRTLRMVDSPGHAKHHHAVLDEMTGTLLVGDAVGVKLPDIGVLRPATPPPDFDLEQATASLRRFRDLRPKLVVLTHYGPVADADVTLAEAEEVLHRWVAVAERTMAENADGGVDAVTAALASAFAEPPASLPANVLSSVADERSPDCAPSTALTPLHTWKPSTRASKPETTSMAALSDWPAAV